MSDALKFYHAEFGDDRPFELYFPKARHEAIDHPRELQKPGVLVLWGGQDISPSIYGRPNHYLTHAPDGVRGRDAVEVALTKAAIDMGMPIFGVCRGAQLVCAMSGGILVQHVTGHVGNAHLIEFSDGKKLPMSTLHHQMMYPWNVEHELLAWTKPLSRCYEGISEEEADRIIVEPEIVFFPKTRAFAIQGHPEYMHPKHPAVAECMRLFKEYAKP